MDPVDALDTGTDTHHVEDDVDLPERACDERGAGI